MTVESATDTVTPAPQTYLKSYELLEHWARHNRNGRGIGCDGRWITYGEWWAKAQIVAKRLTEIGDRSPIALIFDSRGGIEFAIAYVACHLAARPALVVNPRLSSEERAFQLDDAGVRRVLTHEGDQVRTGPPPPKAEPLQDSWGEVIADILYSSGTTGTAKGILTSHAGLWVSAGLAANYTYAGCRDRVDNDWRMTNRDTLVTALPVCSSASSIGFLNVGLLTGAALHYLSHFDGGSFSSFVRDVGGTIFYGSPSLLALWRQAEPGTGPLVRAYKTIGAPVPTALADWAITAFDHKSRLINCYGLTEGNGAVLMAVDQELVDHPGAIGRTVPGVEAKIIDGDGREASEGELWLKAVGMMEGYLNRPDATSRTLKDGWLLTGDHVVDDGGVVCLRGRSIERINRGGFKIYPSELEEIVTRIAGVLDAAAVGVPHEILGEDVALAVEIVPGFSKATVESRIREELQQRLGRYKVPRRILFFDVLPRSTLGKVIRGEVRGMFSQQ